MKFNENREREYKKRKCRENTRQYKRQRIARKKARAAETDQSQLLEGQTYQSGVQFAEKDPDITKIPAPLYPPTLVPVSPGQMKISKLVVFDLETSNIGESNTMVWCLFCFTGKGRNNFVLIIF